MDPHYLELLRLLIPETILVVAALVALGCDLVQKAEPTPERRKSIALGLSVLGCLSAAAAVLLERPDGAGMPQWLSSNTADQWVRITLIGFALIVLGLSWKSALTRHVGETYFLILVALIGMLLMTRAEHLLLVFLSLELVALSFYLLIALSKEHPQSAEGALKYFLLGSVSAAFTLFGISFIYGATGALDFSTIAAQSERTATITPFLIVGIVFVTVGFGFKIAAVPMHAWAPDVYQTAAVPIAVFIASASKLAGFYLFARLWTIGLAPWIDTVDPASDAIGWRWLLILLAFASLLIGNLAAIAQSSCRRLLAWSAVAHASHALLGILANDTQGMAALLYYLLVYSFAVTGAFALIWLVESHRGDDRIDSFAGLYRQFPLEALCLMLFMLSLAGVPPLAGFFGKFYLFLAAVQSPDPTGALFWLVTASIAMSAVSLYYYLQVLKQAFAREGQFTATRIPKDPVIRTVAVSLAAAVFVLGCFPQLVLDLLHVPN